MFYHKRFEFRLYLSVSFRFTYYVTTCMLINLLLSVNPFIDMPQRSCEVIASCKRGLKIVQRLSKHVYNSIEYVSYKNVVNLANNIKGLFHLTYHETCQFLFFFAYVGCRNFDCSWNILLYTLLKLGHHLCY